jgi:hypothetical protein
MTQPVVRQTSPHEPDPARWRILGFLFTVTAAAVGAIAAALVTPGRPGRQGQVLSQPHPGDSHPYDV